MSRDLLAYWHMLCDKAEGNLPTRAMVDPAAIGPRLLPHIFLCEYLDDGDVLIRLQGSYLAARAYQTLTNQRIGSGFFGASAPAILAVYDAVRLHRCPIATHETRRHEGILIKAEVMHAPLHDGNGNLRYVLGALDRIDDESTDDEVRALRQPHLVRIVDPF